MANGPSLRPAFGSAAGRTRNRCPGRDVEIGLSAAFSAAEVVCASISKASITARNGCASNVPLILATNEWLQSPVRHDRHLGVPDCEIYMARSRPRLGRWRPAGRSKQDRRGAALKWEHINSGQTSAGMYGALPAGFRSAIGFAMALPLRRAAAARTSPRENHVRWPITYRLTRWSAGARAGVARTTAVTALPRAERNGSSGLLFQPFQPGDDDSALTTALSQPGVGFSRGDGT